MAADKNKDWEVRIDTHEDAKRFSRLGGYAGFTYITIITTFALLGVLMGKSSIGAQEDKVMYMVIAGIFAHFAVFWILSLRAHTGRGYIAAALVLGLFLLEQIIMTFSILKSGMLIGVIIPILFSIFGIVLYAGLRGNWAGRKFRSEAVEMLF